MRTIVVTVIALFVIGVVLLIVRGVAASNRKKALRAAHPSEPWMWREEWARNLIPDSNRQAALGLWVFGIIWCALTFPLAWKIHPQVSRDNPGPGMVYLFPLVGVIILIAALYQTLRSAKFGTSICHLERLPVVPGRLFRGDIQVNRDVAPPPEGYRLRLTLINAITSGSGKSRSTNEHVVWDTEIAVEPGAVMRSPMGTRIPFQFATPPDAHPTDDGNYNNRWLWRLAASAELSGVDYAATFELPVFQTGETVDSSEFIAFEQKHRAAAARIQLKPASGVVTNKLPGGGEEFLLKGRTTFARALTGLTFLAIWSAAVVALVYFKAPFIFTFIFGAIDLLLFAGMADSILGSSTIEVDANGVRVRRRWLGVGGTTPKSYDPASIVSIEGTSASASGPFGVTLKLRDGGTKVIGSNLPDRGSADAVAARMMAGLGRT